MKKIIFLSILLVFVNNFQVFSWDKNKAMALIEQAEKLMSDLDRSENKSFLPAQQYAEGVVNVVTARNKMEKEEYIISYFHAKIANVYFKAAKIIADSKKIKYSIIVYERNHYKEKSSTAAAPMEKSTDFGETSSITNANLFKKGNVYRLILADRNIFNKRAFAINKYGSESLKKILPVLQQYPNSIIKIIGHSKFYDVRRYSLYKAKKIAQFFLSNNIDRERIKYIGVGNKVVMNTIIGYKRINRIEIVITGIAENNNDRDQE